MTIFNPNNLARKTNLTSAGLENKGDFLEIILELREKLIKRSNILASKQKHSSTTVSVIVLNLNGEKVLKNCLDCLLRQTHQKLQIIVVDNGSTDLSTQVIDSFKSLSANLISLSTGANLGVSGGRNFALKHAEGEVIAFIDNDGYAAPDWISAGLETLLSSEEVGAIGPVVFFNRNKLILNGAGGTINRQGYAGDLCYSTPYEFADIPSDVLYPMGCGMMIKRRLVEKIFPLDDVCKKWFDDTELGLRVWRLGYRVVVAKNSFVDHDFQSSDVHICKNGFQRAWLFESARIRHSLKYLPAKQLIKWWITEWKLLFAEKFSQQVVLLVSWLWNVGQIASLIRLRRRWTDSKKMNLAHPIAESWGRFPPNLPDNNNLALESIALGNKIIFDQNSDSAALLWGWYPQEGNNCRLVCRQASALFNLSTAVKKVRIKFCPTCSPFSGLIILRKFGDVEPSDQWQVNAISDDWQIAEHQLNIAAGIYELIIDSQKSWIEKENRITSMRVSEISFDYDN